MERSNVPFGAYPLDLSYAFCNIQISSYMQILLLRSVNSPATWRPSAPQIRLLVIVLREL